MYVQCSYNGSFRGHYPAIGAVYNSVANLFQEDPQPYPSWQIDASTGRYEAPTPYPELDTSRAAPLWDEGTLSWDFSGDI